MTLNNMHEVWFDIPISTSLWYVYKMLNVQM